MSALDIVLSVSLAVCIFTTAVIVSSMNRRKNSLDSTESKKAAT